MTRKLDNDVLNKNNSLSLTLALTLFLSLWISCHRKYFICLKYITNKRVTCWKRSIRTLRDCSDNNGDAQGSTNRMHAFKCKTLLIYLARSMAWLFLTVCEFFSVCIWLLERAPFFAGSVRPSDRIVPLSPRPPTCRWHQKASSL